MIFLNPTCFVLWFNLIVWFLFLFNVGFYRKRKMYLIGVFATYTAKRKITTWTVLQSIGCTPSALILAQLQLCDRYTALAPPCFSAWACFPGLALSFGFDSVTHIVQGPLCRFRWGRSDWGSQVTDSGTVMFTYCSLVKS